MSEPVSAEPPAIDIEREKLELERLKFQLEERKLEADIHFRRSNTTNQYARDAMRAVLLINGAACIAVLSFAGASVAGGKKLEPGDIKTEIVASVIWFGAGVAAAAFSSIWAYYARLSHEYGRIKTRKARTLERVAWTFGVIGLLMFPIGAISIASKIAPLWGEGQRGCYEFESVKAKYASIMPWSAITAESGGKTQKDTTATIVNPIDPAKYRPASSSF